MLAKKKVSTGGTGTCAAPLFSLRLSGWPDSNSAMYFLLEELADGEWVVFCSVTLSQF
jgi:hypothetical protein